MTFPVIKHSSVTIEQINDTRIAPRRYYRNRQRGNKASFFMISITSPPLKYAEFMETSAKIEAYEGALSIFDLNNPLPPLASFGTQSVNATANANQKNVIISGNRAFKAGDFVQFSNHDKAYRIANVVQSTNTTITLTSPLVSEVNNTHTMTYGANVVFKMCLDSTFTSEVSASNSKFGVVDVELIEQA